MTVRTRGKTLEAQLASLLADPFPGMTLEVGRSERWNRTCVTFRWAGFAKLLPEERFHRLTKAIPEGFRESRMRGFVWLELAPDDSHVVLTRHSLDVPSPLERGPLVVRSLYYGSGTDKHRPEYRDSGAFTTGSVDASIEPPLPHRVAVLRDGSQMNIIPEAIADDCEYRVRVKSRYTSKGKSQPVEGELRLMTRSGGEAPALEALGDHPFRVARIAIYAPAIVPSFDQIGIASLSIDMRVQRTGNRDRVVAWGVKKFGITEKGEIVGVPVPRHLYFALAG